MSRISDATGINIDVAGPNQIDIGGGQVDFLGQLHDVVGGLFESYMKWPGIQALKEGWNEASNFNKDREKTYENKVKADEQSARQKLIDDGNKRKALLDEMASLAAVGGRGRWNQFSTMFSGDQQGEKDLLGV